MNEWNYRIREAREAKYLQSKGVAEIVGISPVYYCNIKKGILEKIC